MPSDIIVSETPAQLEEKKLKESQGTPSHWLNAVGTAFRNPWPSWRDHSIGDALKFFPTAVFQMPSPPKDIDTKIKIQKPTWGLDSTGSKDSPQKLRTTWLGHACFLVELPSSPSLSRGARILFDPIFSDRCSPVQFMGPKRYTQPPCSIEDIPDIDAIVISHNHYDHLDTHTILSLFKRSRRPHIFAPLGNQSYFSSLKIPTSHTHLLDWWEGRRVEVPLSETEKVAFDVTCTPCQHFTGRSLTDRFKSLWSSWVIEEVKPEEKPGGSKVFFAGDTGYRSVQDGQDEENVPSCPVFKEIGEKFGGFDMAMIPIGAYLPRHFMSPIHCAPQDSVRLFQDIRAKRAVGMHWGTWILTSEEVDEPPKRLAEECQKLGIEEGIFTVCDIGQTLFF